MQRILGLVVATLAFSTLTGVPAGANSATTGDSNALAQVRVQHVVRVFDQGRHRGAMIDVAALLTAARGAPPAICLLASQAVRGWGWGGGSDAPSTPLSPAAVDTRDDDVESDAMPAADIQRLLAGLSSDDLCVRELSVRLIGTQKAELVSGELVTRLGSSDPALRTVAALGLGLADVEAAVDPLIRTLRDASIDVRANSAWALGRIENGRALNPLLGLFRDDAEKVRLAAVSAVGHMDDSTSSIPALIRVVRQDNSPAVRRVAAWALGKLEAREAIDALSEALARDADVRVREMSAWALGNIEDRRSIVALSAAIRGDAEDRVRETAVWALGNIGDHSSIDILGAATGDRSANVRGTAAWAIGQMDDGAKAPAGLLRLLSDDNADTRLKAAWALGQLEDASALPAIRDALKVEKTDRVRRGLIRALMKSGESSQATLTQLLTSSDPQIREAAVRGIAGARSFDPWPWPWPRPRPFP